MLGKASEIKISESNVSEFIDWKERHPDAQIVDIKFTESLDCLSYFLIIYKEDKPNGN